MARDRKSFDVQYWLFVSLPLNICSCWHIYMNQFCSSSKTTCQQYQSGGISDSYRYPDKRSCERRCSSFAILDSWGKSPRSTEERDRHAVDARGRRATVFWQRDIEFWRLCFRNQSSLSLQPIAHLTFQSRFLQCIRKHVQLLTEQLQTQFTSSVLAHELITQGKYLFVFCSRNSSLSIHVADNSCYLKIHMHTLHHIKILIDEKTGQLKLTSTEQTSSHIAAKVQQAAQELNNSRSEYASYLGKLRSLVSVSLGASYSKPVWSSVW